MVNKELINKLMAFTDEEKIIISGEKNIDRSIYMENDAPVVNGAKILKNGKKIAVRKHPRFIHFPEHIHDFVEVVYMCSGETTHLINGERVVLREGEFLFLSQFAKQEILPAGENDIAVNFIILPDFFEVSLEMMREESSPIKSFIINCLKGKGEGAYLHFKVGGVFPVQNLAECLIWTLFNDVPNERKINEFSFGVLFLNLLNYTDMLQSKNSDTDFSLQVLQYVEENYKTGSLTCLAEIMHYDLNCLSRKIKKEFGKNYIDLIQEKRLSQSCFLLKNTNMNIDEISSLAGYSNVSYFHKLFCKTYGTSPKKYRHRFFAENSANKEGYLGK